jgi:hypothetical protein
MSICTDVLEEARRLIDVGAARGLTMRLLGGLAVALHSPSAAHRALARSYPDIDFVVPARSQEIVDQVLTGEGYVPNKRFNTLSQGRQLYYDPARGRQVDVFVGSFQMCHQLPVAGRLHLEPLTLPLAELFLTKAQIVTLNRKDVLDLVALLLDHPLGPGDDETINLELICSLCAQDWGLYTTVSQSLQRIEEILAQGELPLDEEQKAVLNERLATLRQTMESAPKSLAWKMRARLGTRVRWYDEVEEVQR